VTVTSPREYPTTIHHREQVMGTIVTIDVYREDGLSPNELLPHLTSAIEELHRADKMFSTWKAQSPVSRLRRGEITLGEAPSDVLDVLTLCRHARDLSGGWFDPWAVPGGVDPTGYVKGWAAQRALDALADASLDGAMVNAAGDIASFGGVAGQAFRVGIVNPTAPTTLACVVELRGALATSGTYERGDHLVNPRPDEPDSSVASASVSGPDLGLADALATALALGGGHVLDRLRNIDGYEGFTIGHGGEWTWTPGFSFAPDTH